MDVVSQEDGRGISGVADERQLSAEFRKKLEEWQRMKVSRTGGKRRRSRCRSGIRSRSKQRNKKRQGLRWLGKK